MLRNITRRLLVLGAAMALALWAIERNEMLPNPSFVPKAVLEAYIYQTTPTPKMDVEAIRERFASRKKIEVEQCLQMETSNASVYHSMYYNKEHSLLICAPQKAGCSTIKRQLLRLIGIREAQRTHSGASMKAIALKQILSKEEWTEALESPRVTRVRVSRHPLDRLVSAYRDKFKDGAPVVSAIGLLPRQEKAASYTFQTFLQMLVDKMTSRNGTIDPHYRQTTPICSPCRIHYHYIFHTDTLSEDFNYVASLLNVTMDGTLRLNNRTAGPDRSYEDYYRDIPPALMRKIYEIFEEDFLINGFELPSSLKYILNR